MLIDSTASTTSWRYFHQDQVGSIDVVTDQTGAVVERLSYDAFGRRRNTNGTDSASFIQALDSYGYTDQEEMDNIGLVNMNGRVYDPTIGRFMSADPTISRPFDLQSHNRYAYVSNQPFISIDPTGFKKTDPATNPDSVMITIGQATQGPCLSCDWFVISGSIPTNSSGGSSGAALGATGTLTAGGAGGTTGSLDGSGPNLNDGDSSAGAIQIASSTGTTIVPDGTTTALPPSDTPVIVPAASPPSVSDTSASSGGSSSGGATKYLNVGLLTNDHDYGLPFDFCAFSDPACTFSNVYAAMTYVPYLTAPGDRPVQDGQESYVAPFGHVTTLLYPDINGLTNFTQPDHTLCCGIVNMQVQPGMVTTVNGLVPGLTVQINGSGTNTNLGLSYLNSLASPFYWGLTVGRQQGVYQSMFGGQPIGLPQPIF